MNYIPFQIDNFRIPTLVEFPVYNLNEGQIVYENSYENGGQFIGEEPRLSTINFAINSMFFGYNNCYSCDNQIDIEQFKRQIMKLIHKEVQVFFIDQADKIYKAACMIKNPQFSFVGDKQFSFSLMVTVLDPRIVECTGDLWVDYAPRPGQLCAEWERVNDLKFETIESDCRTFKHFFRPDYVPEFPGYFPNVRSSLIFLGGQMLLNTGQALLVNQGFQLPYPEITTNDLIIDDTYRTQVELYYFFAPPVVNDVTPALSTTSRKLNLADKIIDIPLNYNMLVVANSKIYLGTNFYNLREIADYDNYSQDESFYLSYVNNLNTKDYFGYYKKLQTIN